MSNDNIRVLPPSDASEIEKAVATAQKAFPELVAIWQQVAKEDFARYQAYRKAGFSNQQAFDLVYATKLDVRIASK